MGFSPDLVDAAKIAMRNTIDFLVIQKHLGATMPTCSPAHLWTSTLFQLVDVNVGVYGIVPKKIFIVGRTASHHGHSALHLSPSISLTSEVAHSN